jgi:hypothetical protein
MTLPKGGKRHIQHRVNTQACSIQSNKTIKIRYEPLRWLSNGGGGAAIKDKKRRSKIED